MKISKKNIFLKYLDTINFTLKMRSVSYFLLVNPQFDPNKNYYKEFWSFYIQNENKLEQLAKYIVENNRIVEKIKELEVNSFKKDEIEEIKLEKPLRKRKMRRTAAEINRDEHLVVLFN